MSSLTQPRLPFPEYPPAVYVWISHAYERSRCWRVYTLAADGRLGTQIWCGDWDVEGNPDHMEMRCICP